MTARSPRRRNGFGEKPVAKFESHITCRREQRDSVERVGLARGWKGSAIDPDPIMGDKPYCYLTAYDSDVDRLKVQMEATAEALLREGLDVLRCKIERIVYDTKTDVNEL
jgi:hypothetical protein